MAIGARACLCILYEYEYECTSLVEKLASHHMHAVCESKRVSANDLRALLRGSLPYLSLFGCAEPKPNPT